MKCLFLDDIMQRPENPTQSDIVEFDSKALKDTRELLDKKELQEATVFIEKNPHPRLWFACFNCLEFMIHFIELFLN